MVQDLPLDVIPQKRLGVKLFDGLRVCEEEVTGAADGSEGTVRNRSERIRSETWWGQDCDLTQLVSLYERFERGCERACSSSALRFGGMMGQPRARRFGYRVGHSEAHGYCADCGVSSCCPPRGRWCSSGGVTSNRRWGASRRLSSAARQGVPRGRPDYGQLFSEL